MLQALKLIEWQVEEKNASGVITRELTVTAKKAPEQSTRPLFLPPVGADAFRDSPGIWPGDWIDATGWLQHYAYGWHTGADLNLNKPVFDSDKYAPVNSIADGTVYAIRTGAQAGGWGSVVCIRHVNCLSRYAHVTEIMVKEGDSVSAGQHIALIGNEGGNPYHLHFDIARLTARMATRPLDWPGKGSAAKERVKRDYLDPMTFLYAMVS